MGMSERGVQQLVQNNLDTMGKIAFAVGQPGHPLDIGEFTAFAQNTLGALMSQCSPQTPGVRRTHNGAWAAA